MSVKLRIFIVGHIALERSADALLTVAIPRREHHDRHYPLLVYESKNATSCTFPSPADLPTDVLEQDPQKKFCALLLSGQEILLSGFQAAGAVGFDDGAIGSLPNSNDRHLFRWAPHMDPVTQGKGKVDKDKIKKRDIVSGRLSLVGITGQATTFGFVDSATSPGGDAYIYSFAFKEMNGSSEILNQAIADNVLVSIPLSGGAVTLTFKEIPEPAFSGSPVLQHSGREAAGLETREGDSGMSSLDPLMLTRDGADESIDIVLASLPAYLKACTPQEEGKHFEHFFDLLKDGSATKRIPVRKDKGPERAKIENDIPPIVRFVEGPGPCFDFVSQPGDLLGLSNRAICTLAVYETP